MVDKVIKVVIVDDEPRLRRGIERLVLSCGDSWEVIGTYMSGKECLETIKQTDQSFDLLITDVKMPEMDGLTLIKELKKELSFYSIVISGFDDFQFLQTAIREGASDYLIKPIDRYDFKKQLDRIQEEIHTQWGKAKQYAEIKWKASQLSYVQQTQKLSEIMWQNEIDISHMDWTKEFPQGTYTLMYVSIDHLLSKSKTFDQKDWNAWFYAVENIIDEILTNSAGTKTWKWKGRELSFWILVHHESDGVNESVLFAKHLKDKIKAFTPFTCSIAVSEQFNELSVLSSIKDELVTYMQFRLLYGSGRIFSKSLLENAKEDTPSIEITAIGNEIDRIIFTLESNHKNKVWKNMNSFLSNVEKLDSPADIKKAVQLLGIRMTNFFITKIGGKHEFDHIQEVFDLTNKTSTISELKIEVYEWTKKMLELLEKQTAIRQLDSMEIAKEWIRNHLNENITIPKIASQVYMNPTYFCEYFKTQSGETVLDYVTRVRIEKAKEILLTSDCKINEVSVKVGYSDTKYFSKLFKKFYGEVPSKYKNRMMHDQI
ncbi:response regulator [Gracilibacillus oryzae]|uniref:Response regulator n=1 Tax=Gracilibacillus oryzae TaxID=1672701 RepID=A0A7C8L3A3_9BACI|nr:response regulator [Gracilibacillus oryzae]KAB8134168.1 response regulator [Gracilibacillus oryzae]